MLNYHGVIVPRLNGLRIRADFRRLRELVRKGIAGFIVFGGELETLRNYLSRLQEEADRPLIIASDLEQGLGQQVMGGTLFPPAMALAAAAAQGGRLNARTRAFGVAREAFAAIAAEARYAGINVVLAPVLDVNTNPRNPIISVRAFGEDPETVSLFGGTMIRELERHGLAACGKHFPGHGDTEVDSHIMLPRVGKNLGRLRRVELKPFERAIRQRVKMIMLGHLSVPAIDPSGLPATLSPRAVRFLREDLGYRGILITDAMNMGGLGGIAEEEASFLALDAGVDILLHPTDVGKAVSFLSRRKADVDMGRLERFRARLPATPSSVVPDFGRHRMLSDLLAARAIRVEGNIGISGPPFLVVLNDDESEKGQAFSDRLRSCFPKLEVRIEQRGGRPCQKVVPEGSFLIVAVFSETKAWKGGASDWLQSSFASLGRQADLLVSFGSPYLMDYLGPREGVPGVCAFWDSVSAQIAAADAICRRA